MTSHGDISVTAARPLLISLLTISTVFGCGQLPQGRERNMTFTVTGFTLPVAMAYSDVPRVRTEFPAISQSQQTAEAFVTRLIMQSEGRISLLLPGVISLILQQLTVQISYTPMKCAVAFGNPAAQNQKVPPSKMTSYGNMAGVTLPPLLISLFTISTVFGCGQLPQGRERTMTFNVTGFTLPVAMAYSDVATVRSVFPGISQSQQAAEAFVTSLIMQSINDVLEQEGRSALLLPGVISLILQQLTVQINYTPMKCAVAFGNPADMNMIMMGMQENCIIVGNTVTAICDSTMAGMCGTSDPNHAMRIQAIPASHLTISGSLRIANPIMAGWSREMWQSVLNRVARNLASGPFGVNFRSASVTVG